MLKIVLLSTEVFNRSTAESIQNFNLVTDMDSLTKTLNEIEGSHVVTDLNSHQGQQIAQVYSLDGFTDACNNQDIELECWWVTYVNFFELEDCKI